MPCCLRGIDTSVGRSMRATGAEGRVMAVVGEVVVVALVVVVAMIPAGVEWRG